MLQLFRSRALGINSTIQLLQSKQLSLIFFLKMLIFGEDSIQLFLQIKDTIIFLFQLIL